MVTKFLRAGTGDAILIQHLKHNIIIDGGNDSKYLLSEVDTIFENEEIIDLLVITHHDDDHIKGIIDLLKHVEKNRYHIENKPFIKRVIFNSPRLVLGKITLNDSKELSYQQAYEVEELLIKLNPKWEMYIDESDDISFEDLTIEFLSPTKGDLNKYSTQKGAYLTGDWKRDWDSPMSKLEPFIQDKSQDNSIPNRSSIVLKISCENKKVLLTGDVTPDRFDVIASKLFSENGNKPVPFDVIKLPHHGSYRSLSKSILEKLECSDFIISTNSKKHFLPNKRALLKVIKYINRPNKEPIKFIFNYEDAIINLGITKQEKKDYNFDTILNNEKYGVSI
ncbi:hypothetical protein LQ567_03365 [Niabella pedocola]|uniref:Metallo-beta-lactamase domain-containing protein n=1 Tax=Niabella pedocola TaxID=1752077 RepID=A0ABS8PLB0_9BACT|nr:MBL fold metallo-hydrolase [Niabella pedocola]MCD2421786.1 hypothetical protein [Niabella pedocola]